MSINVSYVRTFLMGFLMCCSAAASARDEWHRSLYLSGGGLWRRRIPVKLRNDTDREVAGDPVTLRIGRAAGEANLVGARAEAVRVCDAAGNEMLFGITGPDGRLIAKGAVPAGSLLTLPVECPPRTAVTYYAYFDNPAAWPVPDFLEAGVGVRNGGIESGAGDTPLGWRHDTSDDRHAAYWVRENPHLGKRCLKTVVSRGAEATWISTRQRDIHIVGGARYVMTAWVKAKDVEGSAGWYIHVGNSDNPMAVNKVESAGAGTYGWKTITIAFVAPEEADRASLGTVLHGTGTAWFDDVTLECQDAPKLSAAAGEPETLRVREMGEYSDWPADRPRRGSGWDYRVPVKVTNLSDRPLEKALAHVSVSFARRGRRGRIGQGDILVRDRGRTIPHSLVGESLLFECEVPARTVRTYYMYVSAGRKMTAGAPAADRSKDTTLGLGSEILSDQTYTEATSPSDCPGFAVLIESPSNLVKNPSFERKEGRLPAGWPGGAEGERPAGARLDLDPPGAFGGRCGRIHVPHDSRTAWTGWRQDVPVTPGSTYLYAAWVKCRDLRGTAKLHAHVRNAGGELCVENPYLNAGAGIGGTADWTLFSGMFTMPEDAATFQVHLTMNTTGTLWHDGVLVTEVAPAALGKKQARRKGRAGDLVVWPVNAIVKVFQDDLPPREPRRARISVARNEKEPLQLALRSSVARKGVRVKVDPLRGIRAGARGASLTDIEIGVVGYVPVDCTSSYYRSSAPPWRRKFPAPGRGGTDGWAGMWPDPLLPRTTFDLAADSTQPVWITVSVPKDAPAGDYRGVVRLTCDGVELEKVPFTVHVWDFALPDENHVAAIYDVRAGRQWRRPGKSKRDVLRELWRFMAENRLCPDRINVNPVFRYEGGRASADFSDYDELAEYYFDELGFPRAYTPRCFYIFGWAHPPSKRFGQEPYEGERPFEGVDRGKLRPEYKRAYQACLKLYWDHVKEKGWADKIVLYISDEPHYRHSHIKDQMKAICDMIHEVDAAIPIYSSTWRHVPEWDEHLDVWGIGHYGCFPVEEMRERAAAGDRLWFTTDGQMCTDTPYCGVERLLPHYCFKYDVEAYEFWGLTWLTYDPYEFGWHSYIRQADAPGHYYWVRYPNGDGYLAYPGGPVGHDGPVSSVRLEQAREGVEDYEYFYLLRDLVAKAGRAGRDTARGRKALETASRLVTIPNAGGRYSTRILPDPDAVLQVKELTASAIEALLQDAR